jgi:predicted PurR-regulated permease PerM
MTEPVATPPAADVPQPQPPRARTRTLLSILVLIALLFTAYLGREVLVPVVLAMFFALCGNPLVSRLHRWRLPRAMSSMVVVGGGLAVTILAGSAMLPAAVQWVSAAPSEIRQHMPQLRAIAKPIEDASKATESLQEMASEDGAPRVEVVERRRGDLWSAAGRAPRALAFLLAVVVLCHFFLTYGEGLLRRVLLLMPGRMEKRRALGIVQEIQSDITRYVLTISLINLGLGLCVGLALYGLGLGAADAALWGATVAVLNFAPYVGPLVAVLLLTVVGMASFSTLGAALAVPGMFLVLNLIESQLVTPMVLGRTMSISPLIVLLWLLLWGWMWGIPGLLLAVPMLVCLKIVCSRVDALRGWASIIESQHPVDADPGIKPERG